MYDPNAIALEIEWLSDEDAKSLQNLAPTVGDT